MDKLPPPLGKIAPQGTGWVCELIASVNNGCVGRDTLVAIGHVVRFSAHVENAGDLLRHAAEWIRNLQVEGLERLAWAAHPQCDLAVDPDDGLSEWAIEYIRTSRDDDESLREGMRFVVANLPTPESRIFPGICRGKKRKAIEAFRGIDIPRWDIDDRIAMADRKGEELFTEPFTPTDDRWVAVATLNPTAWWIRGTTNPTEPRPEPDLYGLPEWTRLEAESIDEDIEEARTGWRPGWEAGSASTPCECAGCESEDRSHRSHCLRSGKRVA